MMRDQIEAYTQSKDAAWATITTSFKVDELLMFCQDIERLFRINPMLIFKNGKSLILIVIVF